MPAAATREVNPEVQVLDDDACLRLLEGGGVGCLGMPTTGAPELRPVNFALVDGDIVVRTGAGSILDAADRHSEVAFQISGIDTLHHTGWSVIATGKLSVLPTDDVTQSLPLRAWASGTKDRYVQLSIQKLSGLRIPEGRGNR